MMRFPPRRILAAVDLSPSSARAWHAARELAERFGARLHAVHCVPPPPPELAAYGLDAEGKARARAELKRRLGPGARLSVVSGRPADVLPRLARERGFDLLVVGVTRRRALDRAARGSVAESLSRSSPCPVLVVPRRRAIRRVLAPVNEGDYSRRGLAAAAVVARAFHARLDVLHIVTDPLFGAPPERLLASRLAELPLSARRGARTLHRASSEGPVFEILREARGEDLVVLTAHRKSLLGDWVLGTTVERVLRHSPVPVLSIPDGGRRSGVVLI
jgi:nucleotide-binding universal stress UspA family protein